MYENLYLNHVVPECQITNKVNKDQWDKRKHRSQEKKVLEQIDAYGSLLEGHQSLAKPDKVKFLNEPKQTELANKNMVSTRCTPTYV